MMLVMPKTLIGRIRFTDSFTACYQRFQSIDKVELEYMISVEDKVTCDPYNNIRFVLKE